MIIKLMILLFRILIKFPFTMTATGAVAAVYPHRTIQGNKALGY